MRTVYLFTLYVCVHTPCSLCVFVVCVCVCVCVCVYLQAYGFVFISLLTFFSWIRPQISGSNVTGGSGQTLIACCVWFTQLSTMTCLLQGEWGLGRGPGGEGLSNDFISERRRQGWWGLVLKGDGVRGQTVCPLQGEGGRDPNDLPPLRR